MTEMQMWQAILCGIKVKKIELEIIDISERA